MIEVEKNFDLQFGDRERLIEDATLIRKRVMTDTYFDTADFLFTTKDYWLRQRDGRWELKTPINGAAANRITDQYHEFESYDEIASALDLPKRAPLTNELQDIGCKPFVTIITTRESYQKGDFHLDFDEMDFGFTTFEVELMIENEEDASLAEKRIMDFAREHGIASTTGAGKVDEFLFRNNRQHYKALLKAGVIREHV